MNDSQRYPQTEPAPLSPPDRTQCLERLHGLLEEETRHYELASAALTRKKEVLLMSQPQKLHQLDQELLALSRKAKVLEKERLGLQSYLGGANWTLAQLIAHMEPERAPVFSRCRERLLRAVRDAERLNQENRELLSLSLQWIQDTVQVIAKALIPESVGYSVQGGKPCSPAVSDGLGSQSTINHSI